MIGFDGSNAEEYFAQFEKVGDHYLVPKAVIAQKLIDMTLGVYEAYEADKVSEADANAFLDAMDALLLVTESDDTSGIIPNLDDELRMIIDKYSVIMSKFNTRQ